MSVPKQEHEAVAFYEHPEQRPTVQHQRQSAEEERRSLEVAFPLKEEVERAAPADGHGDARQKQNLRAQPASKPSVLGVCVCV